VSWGAIVYAGSIKETTRNQKRVLKPLLCDFDLIRIRQENYRNAIAALLSFFDSWNALPLNDVSRLQYVEDGYMRCLLIRLPMNDYWKLVGQRIQVDRSSRIANSVNMAAPKAEPLTGSAA